MDAVAELRLLLLSRHRLIVARADDETRFMGYLREAADLSGLPVWTWSATGGLARDGLPPQANTREAAGAIAFVAQVDHPSVFVLQDAEDALEDPTTVRAVKERAMEAAAAQTLVLTGPTIEVPDELHGLALLWTLAPPSRAEIERLVSETLAELRARGLARVDLSSVETAELVESLRGVSLPEAQRLILRSALQDGRLDDADLPALREAKAELLAEDGILTLLPTDERGLDSSAASIASRTGSPSAVAGSRPRPRDTGSTPPEACS